jgi:hypothetical protein
MFARNHGKHDSSEKEKTVMQPSSGVLKTAYGEAHSGLHKPRYRLQRVSAEQMVATIAIVSSTLAIVGVVLFCLVRAMQDLRITGSFPF